MHAPTGLIARPREGQQPSLGAIFVQEGCEHYALTRYILERARGTPIVKIGPNQTPWLPEVSQPLTLRQGKQILVLQRNKGKFLKACPGTKHYLCCGYQVLNIGMNCPLDCVYCILQAYLNNPWLSFFVNVDDLLGELAEAFALQPGRLWRIGTGEFTDSLVLDHLTGLSTVLVEFFRDQGHAILELKTKTVNIDRLRGLDHGGRTIVSWSLNSPQITAREEHLTAGIEQRLQAAARCASWGYWLAFHFDPIVYHKDWQQGYAATIRRLFEVVPKERIVWISLGALRFLPRLKSIAQQRFPASTFFCEEFVPGLDGKLRYFRSLRVEMYHYILSCIRQVAGETFVYLCMENEAVWQAVFGYSPEERGGLSAMLDQAAQKIWSLDI